MGGSYERGNPVRGLVLVGTKAIKASVRWSDSGMFLVPCASDDGAHAFLYYSHSWTCAMQKSTSLEYEPASEPLHISEGL